MEYEEEEDDDDDIETRPETLSTLNNHEFSINILPKITQ